jgi:plasmid stabilization system protein ParE
MKKDSIKFKIEFSAKARKSILAIKNWLNQVEPAYASRILREITQKIDDLEFMPKRCGLAYEGKAFKQEIRQVIIGKGLNQYRALFVVKASSVIIVDIRHSSRRTLSKRGITEN